MILLGEAADVDVVRLGETLRLRFNQLAAQRVRTPEPVTLSIGAVLFDQPPESLAALLERGDGALYEAKRGGRDGLRMSVG